MGDMPYVCSVCTNALCTHTHAKHSGIPKFVQLWIITSSKKPEQWKWGYRCLFAVVIVVVVDVARYRRVGIIVVVVVIAVIIL